MPVLLFLTLGIFYPLRRKFKYFSSLPGTKDVITALGWAFVCVYVPASSHNIIFSKSAALACAYGFLLVFTRSVILSIGTEYKDIILSKESFYKAFGITKTKIVLTFIILALTAVLIKLLLMHWKTDLVSMLLLGHIYTVITVVYFYSKRIPRGVFSETVIDGQFYLLALLAFINALI
jgi:4-hydroxy-3-methylbut-2-enyl diphosphate reductase